jgi:hypothetical protein
MGVIIADTEKNLNEFRRNWQQQLEDERFRQLTRHREMSQETTATLRAFSTPRNATPQPLIPDEPANLGLPVDDDHMVVDSEQVQESAGVNKDVAPLVIATDFGTTFSSVAFARRDGNVLPIVRMITNYPSDPMVTGQASMQVPTESWYPTKDQMRSFSYHSDIEGLGSEDIEDDIYDLSDSEQDRRNASNDGDQDTSMDLDSNIGGDAPRNITWGYGVQSLIRPDVDLKGYNRVLKSKLLLDASEKTQRVRDELRPALEAMKSARIIKEDDDVIANYLARLFSHVKQQLTSEYYLADGIPIEHVLCVPVVWSAKACRRMQKAMEVAIKESQLGTMGDLFFVSEPEAAAQYLIGETREINVSRYYAQIWPLLTYLCAA